MTLTTIPQAPPLSAAAEPPLLRVCGALDSTTYEALVEAAATLLNAGVGRLRIDLSATNTIGVAGLVGLFAIAELVDGRPLPDFENGWGTIHAMLDSAATPRRHDPRIELVGLHHVVADALDHAGLLVRFTTTPHLPAKRASMSAA